MKVIFCDIDGCLNAGKHVPLDLATLSLIRQRIAELREHGIKLILVTGRPQPYAEAISQVIETSERFVFENGSAIFDPRTDQVQPVIDPASERVFEKIASEIKRHCAGLDGLEIEQGKRYSISLSGPKIYNKSTAGISNFMDELAATFPDAGVEWAHSSTAIDITAVGINKWTACKKLLQQFGTSPDECGAIGDSFGDLCVLKEVKMAMCPSNASKDVKLVSKIVATQAYEKGTLELLTGMLRSTS